MRFNVFVAFIAIFGILASRVGATPIAISTGNVAPIPDRVEDPHDVTVTNSTAETAVYVPCLSRWWCGYAYEHYNDAGDFWGGQTEICMGGPTSFSSIKRAIDIDPECQCWLTSTRDCPGHLDRKKNSFRAGKYSFVEQGVGCYEFAIRNSAVDDSTGLTFEPIEHLDDPRGPFSRSSRTPTATPIDHGVIAEDDPIEHLDDHRRPSPRPSKTPTASLITSSVASTINTTVGPADVKF